MLLLFNVGFFQEVSHRGTCVALDARKRAGGIREEKIRVP